MGITLGSLIWLVGWLGLGLAFVALGLWRRRRKESSDDVLVGLMAALAGMGAAFLDWITGSRRYADDRDPDDDLADR
jgi:hypothetical protein